MEACQWKIEWTELVEEEQTGWKLERTESEQGRVDRVEEQQCKSQIGQG